MHRYVAPGHDRRDMRVCGDVTDDGGHVRVQGNGPPMTMARIFKRGPRELWGVAGKEPCDGSHALAAWSANLYWLVEVREHERQLTGYICTIALLYPDDHDAAHHLIHALRAVPPRSLTTV